MVKWGWPTLLRCSNSLIWLAITQLLAVGIHWLYKWCCSAYWESFCKSFLFILIECDIKLTLLLAAEHLPLWCHPTSTIVLLRHASRRVCGVNLHKVWCLLIVVSVVSLRRLARYRFAYRPVRLIKSLPNGHFAISPPTARSPTCPWIINSRVTVC